MEEAPSIPSLILSLLDIGRTVFYIVPLIFTIFVMVWRWFLLWFFSFISAQVMSLSMSRLHTLNGSSILLLRVFVQILVSTLAGTHNVLLGLWPQLQRINV